MTDRGGGRGDEPLFAMTPRPTIRLERLASRVPVLLVDDFYLRPGPVRQMALGLPYSRSPSLYPGRRAGVTNPDPSFQTTLDEILRLVNACFLPVVPLANRGRRVLKFSRLETDFAIVDVHPDNLKPEQRQPHVDPVPIFGLVYLNEEERGGTLFFDPKPSSGARPERRGYFNGSDSGFEQCGRIEGRFNRLAIYPGFIPHSAEIVGDWIREGRSAAPRLTQRLIFFE